MLKELGLTNDCMNAIEFMRRYKQDGILDIPAKAIMRKSNKALVNYAHWFYGFPSFHRAQHLPNLRERVYAHILHEQKEERKYAQEREEKIEKEKAPR